MFNAEYINENDMYKKAAKSKWSLEDVVKKIEEKEE